MNRTIRLIFLVVLVLLLLSLLPAAHFGGPIYVGSDAGLIVLILLIVVVAERL